MQTINQQKMIFLWTLKQNYFMFQIKYFSYIIAAFSYIRCLNNLDICIISQNS
ncbi:hypothetical protein pb186bvf_013094 [Paramecium bursaria]